MALKTKLEIDAALQEVLQDSPTHLTKLLELRQSVSDTRAEFLDAKEHLNECKKSYEGARQKVENYLKDLTDKNMFDKTKEKGAVKPDKDATELKPVWPFPLPVGMRALLIEDLSKREEVKSLGATLVSSLRDKDFNTAGEVEIFCGGAQKNAKLTDHAATGIKKLLDLVGQRQGTILLNALADAKAKWVEPKQEENKKPDGWPFPVEAPLCDHSISQVANKFPRAVTTASAAKLAEAGFSTLADLNKYMDGMTTNAPLEGLIGPGPAKKLIDAISKYIADAE